VWDLLRDIGTWVIAHPLKSLALAVLPVLGWKVLDLFWDRTIAPAIHRTLDARADRRAAKKKQDDLLKKAEAVKAELDRIEDSRVGRRFLFRAHAGDPGMIGDVIELHHLHPRTMVRVQWTSQPGREPHEDDYSTDRPIGMEWRQLTRSPDYWRHHTAHFVLKSDDDDDGWVMYEETT